jgi:hypothetical protein
MRSFFAHLRRRLTYANVMATIAVFIALGGTSYAVVELSKSQVKTKHIAKNAVTTGKVKDGSLLGKDFKAGQLVAGAPGPAGPAGTQGTQGSKGDPGAKGDKGDAGPGTRMVSSEVLGGYTTVIGTTCTNYVGGAVTIDVPGPGRVLVDATTNVVLDHTLGASQRVQVSIGSTSTDCSDWRGAGIHGVPAALPTAHYRVQLPSKRVFNVPSAGTYTYYLNGQMFVDQISLDRFLSNRMTATFFPN